MLQLLRDIPFTAIFWTLTEAIRGPLLRRAVDDGHPLAHTGGGPGTGAVDQGPAVWQVVQVNAIAAGVSGSVAAAATTPFDVIKTQQQVARGGTGKSLVETARGIVNRGGFGGLWVGLLPRSIRAFPSGAMVVATYELLKQHLAARQR